MGTSQFDDDVRALVRAAQDRARALGHPWIGCEHLLYAIAHSSTPVGEVARAHGGPVPPILAALGVSPPRLSTAILARVS